MSTSAPTSTTPSMLDEKYALTTSNLQEVIKGSILREPTSPIYFGKFLVTPQVFHLTAHSFALVNIRPLLPGHILVSSRRVVPRLSDLTAIEVCDLFLTVQRVARMLERVYEASALTIPLQDGFDAGQSVPHIHVHILPRKPADLDHLGGVDAVYDLLEGDEGDIGMYLRKRQRPRQPKVDEESLKQRSDEEMAEQAQMLRREMEKEKF